MGEWQQWQQPCTRHAGYVHHTPWGDWSFAEFRAGMEYVDSVFAGRRYQVLHMISEGSFVAAYVRWTATRRADGSAVDGRGAYHCRLTGGLVAEDWDAFFPSS
jgi:SnoaL-like domain